MEGFHGFSIGESLWIQGPTARHVRSLKSCLHRPCSSSHLGTAHQCGVQRHASSCSARSLPMISNDINVDKLIYTIMKYTIMINFVHLYILIRIVIYIYRERLLRNVYILAMCLIFNVIAVERVCIWTRCMCIYCCVTRSRQQFCSCGTDGFCWGLMANQGRVIGRVNGNMVMVGRDKYLQNIRKNDLISPCFRIVNWLKWCILYILIPCAHIYIYIYT